MQALLVFLLVWYQALLPWLSRLLNCVQMLMITSRAAQNFVFQMTDVIVVGPVWANRARLVDPTVVHGAIATFHACIRSDDHVLRST